MCRRPLRHAFGFILLLVVLQKPAMAAGTDLVLAVQPVLNETQTRAAFQPLCDYLASVTQRRCTLLTTPNFYVYWDKMRRGKDFNLTFDAAHFTDYRIQKLGFEVLAKIPDTVTYTIVTRDTESVFDASELVGKRMATLGVPSIGAAQLNKLYPNPVQQPIPVEVPDAEQGMKMLLDGRVRAAILPTPIVAQFMARGAGVSVVLTTEPIPHIALSAAPSLDAATHALIRKALIDAQTTEQGRATLAKIGFERFVATDATLYRGEAQVLRQYFGY